MGDIDDARLEVLAGPSLNSEYGIYLVSLLKERAQRVSGGTIRATEFP